MKFQAIILLNNIVFTIYAKYEIYLDFCNDITQNKKIYCNPSCKLLKKLWHLLVKICYFILISNTVNIFH